MNERPNLADEQKELAKCFRRSDQRSSRELKILIQKNLSSLFANTTMYTRLTDRKRLLDDSNFTEILPRCLSDTGLISFAGFSQISQNCSFLLAYIHENPEALVTIVKSSLRQPNFHRLVTFIIPSIYGFFSSEEICHLALRFYRAAIIHFHHPLSFRIIEPFLCGALTHRFFESVAESLFHSCLLSATFVPEEDRQAMIPIFAHNLLKSLTQFISLLPHQIVELFQAMSNQMSIKSLIDAAFNYFIWPQIFRSLLILPGAFSEIYYHGIIKCADEDVQGQTSFVYSLLNAQPVTKLPNVISEDRPFFTLLVDYSDILTLISLLDSNKMLMENMVLHDFSISNSAARQFTSFYVEIYPKPGRLPEVKREASDLFGSEFDIHELQTALDNMSLAIELRGLYSIVQSFGEVLGLSLLRRFGSFYEKPIDQSLFDITFSTLSEEIDGPILQKLLFLHLLDSSSSFDEPGLMGMDKSWDFLLNSKNEKENCSEFDKACRRLPNFQKERLSYAMVVLCSLGHLNHRKRLVAFLWSFDVILQIAAKQSEPHKFMRLVFSRRKNSPILSTFLILNSRALHRRTFYRFLSPQVMGLWRSVSDEILSIAKDDVFICSVVEDAPILFSQHFSKFSPVGMKSIKARPPIIAQRIL